MSNLSTGRHLMRHLDFLRMQKLCKIVMCAEKTRLLRIFGVFGNSPKINVFSWYCTCVKTTSTVESQYVSTLGVWNPKRAARRRPCVTIETDLGKASHCGLENANIKELRDCILLKNVYKAVYLWSQETTVFPTRLDK